MKLNVDLDGLSSFCTGSDYHICEEEEKGGGREEEEEEKGRGMEKEKEKELF